MFLSSLLPAHGHHYFKCHTELNFYTTKPIKINLTWGYFISFWYSKARELHEWRHTPAILALAVGRDK
ncbi:hypothetical protein LEMLEM_LOCUS11122 [Lemmus lemmus]